MTLWIVDDIADSAFGCLSLVLSLSRLVPVLSHGGTAASFKSWQDWHQFQVIVDWFDLIFLTLPQGRAGCPLVEEDVAVGAPNGRLKSGSCSDNFLTAVRWRACNVNLFISLASR